MKALTITARGTAPAILDIADPEPVSGTALVAVHAASINGFDLAVAAGYLWDSLPHTFPVVLGRDYAGTVAAVPHSANVVAVGDRVAGIHAVMQLGAGPLGEQFVVDKALLVHLPDTVSFVQAAAVGLAGVTALDLLDALQVDDGDVVLVSGATGGVGAFAVQLAKARGARVIATARPGEAAEFVRGLGADDTLDYTGDIAAAMRDVLPGGVGKIVHAAGDPVQLAAVLAEGGSLASAIGADAEQVGRDDVTVIPVLAGYEPAKLAGLLADVAAGRLQVPVAATFALEQATDALSAFGESKLGKIVVTI